MLDFIFQTDESFSYVLYYVRLYSMYCYSWVSTYFFSGAQKRIVLPIVSNWMRQLKVQHYPLYFDTFPHM